MKLSIIYESKTGNTSKAAQYICEGAEQVSGVQAKAFHIENIDEAYVKESCGLIVGSPTYNGCLSGKLKVWLESGLTKLDVAGKLGGAFATAAFIHGGGDFTIQCILTHLMVEGMMTYSGGQASGMPVIHLGPVGISPNIDEFADLFRIYGQRMAKQVVQLKGAS